jgi:hypothetical protein
VCAAKCGISICNRAYFCEGDECVFLLNVNIVRCHSHSLF